MVFFVRECIRFMCVKTWIDINNRPLAYLYIILQFIFLKKFSFNRRKFKIFVEWYIWGGDIIKNQGIRNEYLFIEKINKKKLNQLTFLLQELILFLYPHIKHDSIILCYKNIEYEKGDIVIQVGCIKKYISIKMGHKNSVHCESVKKFKDFLEEINISKHTINEILKYQHADGTLDGTGVIRISSEEYKKENKNSIDYINMELNNKIIIPKIVDRFIIKGTQYQNHKIDLLVYGVPEDFLFITPKEIQDYIMSKTGIKSSAVHFSCLTLQPLSRVLNYNKKLEYMRNWIQIKWYNIEDNIIEVMNERYQKGLNN